MITFNELVGGLVFMAAIGIVMFLIKVAMDYHNHDDL